MSRDGRESFDHHVFEAQQRQDRLHQSGQHWHEWMQTATRFFVLANAGAAVATLSLLGTSEIKSWPVVTSLACFFIGVVVAGFVIMGQLTGAYRTLNAAEMDSMAADVSIKASWVTRFADRIERHTGLFLSIAFGLFILGGIIGIAGLGAFEPSTTPPCL